MIRATAEKTIIDLTEPISVILSNESQSFSTNSSRLPLGNASYYTDVIVYRGSNEITDFVIGNVSSANGITVNVSGSRITFSVNTSTTITADSGTFIIPITVDEQVIKKTFSWSCSKQGNTGQSAVTYFIEPSTLVIKKGYDDTFSPTTVTFSSYSRIGSSTTRTSYAGRFIISESTDGTTFTAKYTSSTNESSKVYTPSSVNIKTIKCVLYASGGTTSSLDTQSVVILTDVENIQPELDNLQDQITTNKTSISTVSSEVDAINKKIVNMVTQDDIESSINDYDKSTTEALRTRISKTEQDIGGIKTTVSDVQSNLKNKADSSTVQSLNSKVTTIEITVNGINTSVSNNYTELRKDIDNLEIGGRNLVRKSSVATRVSQATYDEKTNTWTITSAPQEGGTWGSGLYISGKYATIPYGKTYTLSFEIKVPRNCTWNTDVNNYPVSGDAWSSNDHDDTSLRKTSSKSLTSGQWIKCWSQYSNTNSKNTNKVDIYDASSFGVVMQNETTSITYQIRNIKGELGNVPTDWTPAPEDIESTYTTKDEFNDLSDSVGESVIQIQSLSEQIIGEGGITSRVAQLEQTTDTMETNILSQCETMITQSANNWRIDFEENGANTGSVVIAPEGITVQSDSDDKHTAVITGGRFSGYYNPLGATEDDLGEEIFTLTEDKVVASQLFAKSGADFNSLRIIPFTNQGYVGCVWVKSGGEV